MQVQSIETKVMRDFDRVIVNGSFLRRGLAFCAAVLNICWVLVILAGLFSSSGLVVIVLANTIVVVVVVKKREEIDD